MTINASVKDTSGYNGWAQGKNWLLAAMVRDEMTGAAGWGVEGAAPGRYKSVGQGDRLAVGRSSCRSPG